MSANEGTKAATLDWDKERNSVILTFPTSYGSGVSVSIPAEVFEPLLKKMAKDMAVKIITRLSEELSEPSPPPPDPASNHNDGQPV